MIELTQHLNDKRRPNVLTFDQNPTHIIQQIQVKFQIQQSLQESLSPR